MGGGRVERRLAAILAADVAGYSRLMGADEEGTHLRLTLHRREFVEPSVRSHHGRIFKRTGDGFLAEFASVVDAVRCAVAIQGGMAERNADLPPDRRIEFCIGINLGDVVVEPDDIYGDGVSLTARLEGIAEPGGICLSRAAHDQVRGKLDLAARDMGEQRLKNIAEPARAYSIAPAAGAPQAGAFPASVPPSSHPVYLAQRERLFEGLRRAGMPEG